MGISSAIPRLDEQWTEHMGGTYPWRPWRHREHRAQTPYPYTRVSDVFTDYVAHPRTQTYEAVLRHPSVGKRERVILLAIGPATKMSAKSFAGNSGPMAVRIHPPAGALGEVTEARRGSSCCGR